MGILDTLKDVAVLVQKADNIDLMKGMIDVQAQAYALLEENQRLKDETRRLEEERTIHIELIFRQNCYWKGDDGPYCSRCWDADRRLIRMHVQQGYRPHCPSCDTRAADPDAPPPRPVQPRRSSRPNWMG